MLIDYQLGQTSIVFRLRIFNASVTTGAGLTGLTNASSGLRIGTIADNESATTAYTAGGSTIQTIATLGTFAAPTSGDCRFKEVDSTSHPGIYEVQLDNARFAVSNAKSLLVSVTGAANAADCHVVIPLRSVNPYSASSFMTGVNGVAPPANWNAQAITAGGVTQADLQTVKTQAVTCGAAVTVGAFVGNASAALQVDGSGYAKVSAGTGTGQVSLASGAVTVGTNNDKAGYSLASAPPTAAAIAAAVLTDATDTGTTGSLGYLIGHAPGWYTAPTTPPTAASIATAVWQDPTVGSDFTTSGSIGRLLAAYVAPPTAAQVAAAVLTDTADTTTAGSLGYLVAHAPGWYAAPSAAAIAAAVAAAVPTDLSIQADVAAALPRFPADFASLAVDASDGGVTVHANNDKAGYAASSVSGTVNAALVASGLDAVECETGYNARQALALVLDAALAKLSGAAGSAPETVTIRDVNDTVNRASVTVDGSGNRTAVTLSPPA